MKILAMTRSIGLCFRDKRKCFQTERTTQSYRLKCSDHQKRRNQILATKSAALKTRQGASSCDVFTCSTGDMHMLRISPATSVTSHHAGGIELMNVTSVISWQHRSMVTIAGDSKDVAFNQIDHLLAASLHGHTSRKLAECFFTPDRSLIVCIAAMTCGFFLKDSFQ